MNQARYCFSTLRLNGPKAAGEILFFQSGWNPGEGGAPLFHSLQGVFYCFAANIKPTLATA